MAVQNMIGKWLTGSGWTNILSQASVSTSGRCDALLKATHVKRVRYAHEVTIAALHVLKHKAFTEDTSCANVQDFEAWETKRLHESAQFQYWSITITLEAILLNFVRSIREGNFVLFVDCLKKICPWLFALDMVHYARWLPVFVKTLEELPVHHPDVYAAFLSGHFSSKKTNRRFSAISDDQVHEQKNKIVKDTGGAVGILDNETALMKWMVSGPEISRMLKEFEEASNVKHDKTEDIGHHEDNETFRYQFLRHVSQVVNSFEESGSPFCENEFVTMGKDKILMSRSATKSVREAFSVGREQYEMYVKQRLSTGMLSVHDVIPRNNLELFSQKVRNVSKDKSKIVSLQTDANIFCRMYVSCQSRAGNVDDFFAHENSLFPPSISSFGKLRKAINKSDLLPCLELSVKSAFPVEKDPLVSSIVLDGSSVIHMLSPGVTKTFSEYCNNVFKPYIDSLLRSVSRIDIVFDRYFDSSLKSEARDSRGCGQWILVKPETIIPKNFKSFLAVGENKEQLFHLLSNFITQFDTEGKVVVSTFDEMVKCNNLSVNVDDISPCSAEEADGRLMLHAKHAVDCGHTKVLIRTVDSDVVIIAVYAFSHMGNIEQLWIDFGVGKARRHIAVHSVVNGLPCYIVDNIPFFHAFTGCDTVSTFYGIGKKTAWKVWMTYRNIDKVFGSFMAYDEINDDMFKTLQRFVVLMYDRTCPASTVNECRRLLFTKKSRTIENIPPTADALMQHTKRAIFQAHVWMECLQKCVTDYFPADYGWKVVDGGQYQPLWITQPDVSSFCSELVSCSCKVRCKNCKCVRSKLACTRLCGCEGHCSRTDSLDIVSVSKPYEEVTYEDVGENLEIGHSVEVSYVDICEVGKEVEE